MYLHIIKTIFFSFDSSWFFAEYCFSAIYIRRLYRNIFMRKRRKMFRREKSAQSYRFYRFHIKFHHWNTFLARNWHEAEGKRIQLKGMNSFLFEAEEMWRTENRILKTYLQLLLDEQIISLFSTVSSVCDTCALIFKIKFDRKKPKLKIHLIDN